MQRTLALTLFALAAILSPLAAQATKTRTYAVRMAGKTVGHSTETETPDEHQGRAVVRYESKTVIKIEVLGASVDQAVLQTWLLDAATREVCTARRERTSTAPRRPRRVHAERPAAPARKPASRPTREGSPRYGRGVSTW